MAWNPISDISSFSAPSSSFFSGGTSPTSPSAWQNNLPWDNAPSWYAGDTYKNFGNLGPSSGRDSSSDRTPDWLDKADKIVRMAGQAFQKSGYDSAGSRMANFPGGVVGGGSQQLTDNLLAAYPIVTNPTVIPASGGGGIGRAIGTLAGAALAAPFTGGASLATTVGTLGLGAQLGGAAGGLFG